MDKVSVSSLPPCPKCHSVYVYADGVKLVCPECAHDWPKDSAQDKTEQKAVVRDANGNVLSDSDSVTVIKNLKIGGSSSVVKGGTKVKNIRLIDSDNGHDIDCTIDGIGAMQLKSEYVKKA